MVRALLATVLLAAPAAAADYVKLVHVKTGKVLAPEAESDEAATKIVVAKDGDGEALQWRVEKDGEFVKLVNRKSGKVLDVFEASKDEGTPIIIWDDKSEDNDNQRWSWAGKGAERQIVSKHSGLVLDVTADGKVVQKMSDEKAKGQFWKVVEVKK